MIVQLPGIVMRMRSGPRTSQGYELNLEVEVPWHPGEEITTKPTFEKVNGNGRTPDEAFDEAVRLYDRRRATADYELRALSDPFTAEEEQAMIMAEDKLRR
jgi:hypothetical protein